MQKIDSFAILKSNNLSGYRYRHEEIVQRVYEVADYIKQTHETIRKTAEVFGLSKSTVHNDVSYKLPHLDGELSKELQVILGENFAQKHIRGGEATRRKFSDKEKEN